jgi:diamine N-acetyltransferase
MKENYIQAGIMLVTLREITMANFHECIGLKVGPGQENYVGSNVYSLAEAKVDGVSIPLAVYADETMVGFVLFSYDEKNYKGYFDRLMIDQRYQGKGYGRAAAIQVVERLKGMPGCREIQISFAPENIAADTLYASIGFVKNGKFVPPPHVETIAILKVE